MSSVETRRNVRRRGILIKFIEEQRGNKYLNGAMTVLSKDEVDSFIEGYKSITTLYKRAECLHYLPLASWVLPPASSAHLLLPRQE